MTDDVLVEKILRAVELVPPGTVATYGDIARVVGIGPRHVGNVLARWGAGVCWWRVTNRDGELPAALLEEARRRWTAEGVTLSETGRGCRITEHRADVQNLADRWGPAVEDLSG